MFGFGFCLSCILCSLCNLSVNSLVSYIDIHMYFLGFFMIIHMLEMYISEVYYTNCLFYIFSSFQFYPIHSTVNVKRWYAINPSNLDNSVWKELSVRLVKEGDSLRCVGLNDVL